MALDGPEAFLDLQLGLRSRFKANRLTLSSERFGIRAGRPEIDERDIMIEITPSGRPGKMRMEFPDGFGVTVPATLFSADDGTTQALRAASPVLDVVFGPRGRARAHAQLKFQQRVTGGEMRAFLHLLSIRPKERVGLQIELDGRLLDMGSIC